MRNGLYKVEVTSTRGFGRGVTVVRDGRIFGGNGGYAFAGRVAGSDAEPVLEINSVLRNVGGDYAPLDGVKPFALKGRCDSADHRFDGHTPLLGGDVTAVMTALSEEAAPPARRNGPNGIVNGLYSLTIRMLDGINAANTGLMLLHDGSIRGGDAFFTYLGAYESAGGRWKGELINHEHTPSQGERPVFGGKEVGIGFSGSYDGDGAVGEATALAGKRSIRFKAVLRKLVAI
ncbi:hypothetical protein J6500_06235 [Bradyrhizobium sp. WSM 1704]|uniref:GrlR family regulatory protein n=1 Tax=Bradyrhizobium semiaridum TaxID=2821404 RepID=UPI001CE305F4|nr:GrlR family regulatory protein [Bradyrhizobium semiaridum]MCA6121504.1 hypothetical protein [Bradyrhizobium semiaridum]